MNEKNDKNDKKSLKDYNIHYFLKKEEKFFHSQEIIEKDLAKQIRLQVEEKISKSYSK